MIRGDALNKMHGCTKRPCPRCRSLDTSRSRRQGGVERYLLRFIGVLPYRCQDCGTGFYAWFGVGSTMTSKA